MAANRGYALKSSRQGIIRHFLENGWQVVLATADDDEGRELAELGAILEPVTFSRGGFSLANDFKAYRRLQSIHHQYRPKLVHHFHAKPVILGSLVARKLLGSNVRIVNSITGLGHAFVKGGMVTQMASAGYRLALPRSDMTVFQNRDDQALFQRNSWVAEHNQRLIVGSGIDVTRFSWMNRSDHDPDAPVIVMMGRLLGQKGIHEFVAVAKQVRQYYSMARFIWAGEEDLAHPDAVSASWLVAQPDVEYVGRLSDVGPLLREADLLLFPSYREGVPRAVMEAAATGLPTVGFDVPGVREAVRHGETGFLLPYRHVEIMAKKVVELIGNSEERQRLGRQARQLAVNEFDVRSIQSAYFKTYRDLGIDIPQPE
ncbi:glycosyltransferase family 4 protein [Halomonas sp.]|uniref:glycosyltransferase family 4 protein n=1 Tax=Halomonas sp. TaxID=1486246 RepID=UPI00384BB19C